MFTPRVKRTPNLPPLTASEEAELVKRFKAGDSEAGNRVLATMYGYFWTLVNQRVRDPEDAEDAFIQVWIECHRALKHFDPERGVPAHNYLSRIITNTLLLFSSQNHLIVPPKYKYTLDPVTGKRLKRINFEAHAVVSMDTKMSFADDVSLGDMIEDDNNYATPREFEACVKQLLKAVPPRYMDLVIEYYGLSSDPDEDGKIRTPTFDEMGKARGISSSAIAKKVKASQIRMREHAQRNNLSYPEEA